MIIGKRIKDLKTENLMFCLLLSMTERRGRRSIFILVIYNKGFEADQKKMNRCNKGREESLAEVSKVFFLLLCQ